MPPRPDCPTDDDLRAFHLGNLAVAGQDAVAAHLDACPDCDSRIARVERSADPVLSALRHPTPPAWAASTSGATVSFSRGDTSPDTGTIARAGSAALAFLAPPRGGDEIGWLGRYRVLRPLGSGGMGMVFLAEDATLQRPVALKTLRPETSADPEARERFLREARAAAAVKSPHVVTLYDVGLEGNVSYLAMELLEGESLEARISRTDDRPLHPAEVVRVGRETAAGLAAAHARGLVHRDIKPANLWLESPTGRVKILDFGLAIAGARDARLTQAGFVVGSPGYLSPEQADGKTLDARSDLFALGCVLYRLATGRPAYDGDTPLSLLTALAVTTPASPKTLNPAIPPELASLILKLLAKQPWDRPETAAEVATDLARIESKIAPQPAESTVQLVAATPPRRRLRTAAIAAGLLAVLLGAAAVVAFRVTTESGEFVVETDDPAINLRVDKAGGLVVKDATKNREFRLGIGSHKLPSGDYAVEVSDADGVQLSTPAFVLKSGETVRLRVTAVPKKDPIAVAVVPKVEPPKIDPKSNPPVVGVDDDWVKKVAALPDATEQFAEVVQKLKDRNPGFDGPAFPTYRDSAVVAIQFSSDEVADISPLRALTRLEKVAANGGKRGIQGAKLADLSPLAGLNLERIELSFTKVADLRPLKGMRELRAVYVQGTLVEDLTPLAGLPLETLWCGNSPVKSLAPLKGAKLKELRVNATAVADLTPLADARLEQLYFEATGVTDVTTLKGQPLTIAELPHGITDFAPIKDCPLERVCCPVFDPARHGDFLRGYKTLKFVNNKPIEEFLK